MIHSGGMGSIADLRRAAHIPSSVHSFQMHERTKGAKFMAGGGQRGLHGEGGKDTQGECSMSVAGTFSGMEKRGNLNEEICKMYWSRSLKQLATIISYGFTH